jgi:hypothetical protein
VLRRVLAVSGAAALIASTGCSSTEAGERAGGPLACRSCSASASLPVPIGGSATYGFLVLENHGSAPAVLDRLSFENRSHGLRIRGVMVMRVGDKPGGPGLAAGFVDGFPPAGVARALQELHGSRIEPFRKWPDAVEVLIGLQAPRAGSFSFDGLKLHYRVNGQRYLARFDLPTLICASSAGSSRPCGGQ